MELIIKPCPLAARTNVLHVWIHFVQFSSVQCQSSVTNIYSAIGMPCHAISVAPAMMPLTPHVP